MNFIKRLFKREKPNQIPIKTEKPSQVTNERAQVSELFAKVSGESLEFINNRMREFNGAELAMLNLTLLRLSDDEENPMLIKKLIEELIFLGRSQKFLKQQDEHHNEEMLHIRTREIGKILNEKGGMPLMRYIHLKVTDEVHYPGAGRELEYCWDGIGHWRS